MDWFKKHGDTVMILGAVFGCFLWMNGKFSEIDKRFSGIERNINELDKRLFRIETILTLKGIIPPELAAVQDQD